MVIDPTPVLITRPAGQEQALAQALRDAGYRVYHQPLLELEPLPVLPAASRRQIMELDLYQQVIFISANAVRFGMDCIEDYWPQLPVGLTWYAVGGTTARLLRECGLDPVSPESEMNSEGLLALPGLQHIEGQRLLIVKGIGGREALQRELERRGARVDSLCCYRRNCPQLVPGEMAASLVDQAVEVLLISSGEGLQNLLTLLSAEETTKFKGLTLVVPSPRVATMAQEAGFSQVVTAANASDEAMLVALEQWKKSAGE